MWFLSVLEGKFVSNHVCQFYEVVCFSEGPIREVHCSTVHLYDGVWIWKAFNTAIACTVLPGCLIGPPRLNTHLVQKWGICL